MKFTPTNFPGRAVVATSTKNHGHGMEQYIKFGYATDENAMTIFVEGDFI